MERLLDGLAAPGRRVVTFVPSQRGVAALAFALERPEPVRRLTLATASGGPAFMRAPGAIWNPSHPDFWHFALLAVLYLVWRAPAAETLMNNLIVRDCYLERERFAPRPVAPRDWFRPARPRAAWGTRVSRQLDYSRRLCLVRAPTLVTVSRFDLQMPPACGEELARGIPDAHPVRFERSGPIHSSRSRTRSGQASRACLPSGPAMTQESCCCHGSAVTCSRGEAVPTATAMAEGHWHSTTNAGAGPLEPNGWLLLCEQHPRKSRVFCF